MVIFHSYVSLPEGKLYSYNTVIPSPLYETLYLVGGDRNMNGL